jgi:flagellar basal-body rod protein FlgC
MADSFEVFDVTASALTAERTRLNVIAQNIANAEVSGNAQRLPYRRQQVLFESVMREAKGRGGPGLPVGAVATKVVDVAGDFRKVSNPGHPDADEHGFVLYPNVSIVDEMVDLIDASRTYEANLSALRTFRDMLRRTIDMVR